MSFSIEIESGDPDFTIVSRGFRTRISEPGWVIDDLGNIIFLPEAEWTCTKLEEKGPLGYQGDRIFRNKEKEVVAKVSWMMVASICRITKENETWSIYWLTP